MLKKLLKNKVKAFSLKKQFYFLGLMIVLLCNTLNAQMQLELANGSYLSAANGLTVASQTASLLQNTSGSSFSSFSPTITVTATISNQQYNNISTSRVSTGKGINFGGRVNSYAIAATQVPVYNSLNTIDNPVNSQYTSNPNGPNSTGIDVTGNYGFYFYNSVDELFSTNAATNGRYYFGNITLTFSQPVSNPVIHIVGLGSNVLFGTIDKQGISTELELQTNGVALSKLSGSNELNVTANKILNNATTPTFNCGSGAACGSVKCAGTNITTLTFKVYVRGDGNGSNWSHTAINAGDEFLLSASINTPVTLAGNVFNDGNGLTDNIVNGIGTNLGGALYVNLVDGNNLIVSSVAVANDGSYLFDNISDGNYNLVLSTAQGTQGNAAPIASLPSGWVNSGENIGTSVGSDGTSNGVLPVTVNATNISNANFGIVLCSNIVASSITANGAITACLGAGLTLTSSPAISYQWYRDTILIVGATSQTYIPTVSGVYTMHIITGGGVCNISSNAINVTINYAPTVNIAANDTTIICVKANDKICPATWGNSNYQWYKNGVAMAAPQGTSSCLYPTTNGNYSLAVQTGAGCWSLPSASVYVKIDTVCTGYVTGGNGGGVESKSLGDVIGKRLYGNAVNSIAAVDGYNNSTRFIKNSGAIINGGNSFQLADILPTKVDNTINAFVTTPNDLVNFTNAIDVLSVDYTDNYNTKAVAFATKTLGEVYSHTKPICDRLKEGQLNDVRKIDIDGYCLIASTIKQRTGEVEYCINFSIGAKTGRNSYSLQSNWLTDNYTKEDTMYNFQLWAASYNTAIAMAKEVIANVKSIQHLQATTSNGSDMPKIFVRAVRRERENIELEITNATNATSIDIKMLHKVNEKASEVTKTLSIALQPKATTKVLVQVNDAYETNLYFYNNGVLNDLVYSNDGAWDISYEKQHTTIKKFAVTNGSFSSDKNEYPLFRKIEVSANTKDYVTAYKLAKGGGLEKNYTDYKSIRFNASGSGASKVKITLIKKGISKWENQYTYTLPIESKDVEYGINLSKFTSTAYTTPIDLKDITALNFTWENNAGGIRNIDVSIDKLRFSKNIIDDIIAEENVVNIYPNPSQGKFKLAFAAIESQPMAIKIVEIGTGRNVYTQYINAKKGANNIEIDLKNNIVNAGLYMILMEGDNCKMKPAKLFINK